MVLKDIMAISGQPGLYRFIAQGKNAIIVEHLETKARSSAFSSARVSSLEEISIFTMEEDMPLGKVFDRIYEKENGGPAIDYKTDPDKLKAWFEEVLPEYNRDKVYVSDIKKVAQWYNLLHKLNLLIKEEAEAEVKDEVEVEVEVEVEAEVKAEVKAEVEVKAEAEAEVKAEVEDKGEVEVKDEVKVGDPESTTGKKQGKQKSSAKKENTSGAGKEGKSTGKPAGGQKQSEPESE